MIGQNVFEEQQEPHRKTSFAREAKAFLLRLDRRCCSLATVKHDKILVGLQTKGVLSAKTEKVGSILKKVLIGCSIACVAVIGLISYGCGKIDDGLCGNDVVENIVSPDGHVKAVVFERDCGATTSFSTQISVVGANAKLPNSAGNVFIADGDLVATGPKGTMPLHITWSGTRQLHIQYPHLAQVHQRSSFVIVGLGWFHNALVHIQYTEASLR